MICTRKKNEDRLRTSCASAEEGRERELKKKEEASNNQFNLTIPVVMVCAVASLGTNHAKPFGPELQVN